MKNRALLHLVLAGLGFAAACKDSPGTAAGDIARIEFSFDRVRASFPVGDTVRVRAHYLAADGGPIHSGPYTEGWRSLDPAVATVDRGLVTMTGQGTAAIEVYADGVVARTSITVKGVLHRQVTASTHWTVAESPHVVEGLFEPSGPDTVVLTIDPGATVLFRPGAGLSFGTTSSARLVVPGGAEPVVMAGDSAGYGTWTGLLLDHGHRHELRNVVMRHCGAVGAAGVFIPCLTVRRNAATDAGPGVVLQDVVIDSASGSGLVVEMGAGLAPESRNLSVRNTRGIVASVPVMTAVRFPRGGTFTGNTADEIQVAGGTVDRPTAWQNLPVSWRLTGSIHVEGSDSATLTLPAGFAARADAGVGFVVGGSLVMGEAGGAPVVIEAQDARGWDGIELGIAPGRDEFHNATLRGCGTGGACVRMLGGAGTGRSLLADHVTIENSRSDGMLLTVAARFEPGSTGLVIHGSQGAPITLPANAVASLPPGDYASNAQNGFRLRDDPFTGTATWTDHGIPYLAPGGVDVRGDLTLAAGVTVKVGRDRRFVVGGATLRALGTAAAPVVLTSLDGDAAGAWVGLELGAPVAAATRLEYLEIRNAGAGEPGVAGALRMWSDPGGVLRNSTILGSAGCGIVLFDGQSWTDDYTAPAFANHFTNVAGPMRCRWPPP